METFIIPISYEETYYGAWLVVDVTAGSTPMSWQQLQDTVAAAVASIPWATEEIAGLVPAVRKALQGAGVNVVSLRPAKYVTMSQP